MQRVVEGEGLAPGSLLTKQREERKRDSGNIVRKAVNFWHLNLVVPIKINCGTKLREHAIILALQPH